MTLDEIADALRARTLRAEELAERALAANRLGAYRSVDAERTLAMARAADAAFDAGVDTGALQGIPVSIKDLYGVPGFPVFAGSPKRLPERFEAAGPVVQRCLKQLAVVTGKTHTVEFAFGGIGTNPHYETPRNPWDLEHPRAPGGSSSGAGVSLSEGSAFVAFGTDTAGSVRIPASWTGNVAIKTTKGRWSTKGIVPLSSSLDTAGILTRTVRDAAFAFRALDPHARPISEAALHGLRIGRAPGLFFEDCSPGVAEAVDQAIGALANAGAIRLSLELPELEPTRALFNVGGPVSTELYLFLQDELPAWYEGLDPNVQARVGNAGNLPAHEYLRRLKTMASLSASIVERLAEVDVLLAPTVANTPPRLVDIATPETYAPQNLLCLRNTCIASYLGLCAVTLPCGRDAAGMPVGLQLIGPPHSEERLLGIALAIEDCLGVDLGTP
ncbi:MAG: amidase [Myxococcota bacterium]